MDTPPVKNDRLEETPAFLKGGKSEERDTRVGSRDLLAECTYVPLFGFSCVRIMMVGVLDKYCADVSSSLRFCAIHRLQTKTLA